MFSRQRNARRKQLKISWRNLRLKVQALLAALLTIFISTMVLADSALAQTEIGFDIDGKAAEDQSGSSMSFSADGTRLVIGASLNDANGDSSGDMIFGHGFEADISDVSIASFTLTPATVLVNTATTVAWSVSNATSCVASNGLGTWGGAVSPIGDVQVINAGSTPGDFTFTLSCNNGGPDVTSNVILTVNPAPIVAINSFTVTPSSIEAGEDVTVSWNTSFADSCSASGAPQWNGPVAVSGTNVSVSIASAGNYTLTLTCSNSTSPSVQQARNVTVTNPSSNCPDPTLDGTIRSWSAEFIGSVWPNPGFGQQLFAVSPRAGYTALEFDTGTAVATGGMVTVAVTANSGTRFGSISPCPGDFTSVPNNCLKDWGPGSSLKWSTEANPDSNECALDPNTTYYFNLTFTDGVDPNTDTCELFGPIPTCLTTLRVFSE